jgi:hypothetical protein
VYWTAEDYSTERLLAAREEALEIRTDDGDNGFVGTYSVPDEFWTRHPGVHAHWYAHPPMDEVPARWVEQDIGLEDLRTAVKLGIKDTRHAAAWAEARHCLGHRWASFDHEVKDLLDPRWPAAEPHKVWLRLLASQLPPGEELASVAFSLTNGGRSWWSPVTPPEGWTRESILSAVKDKATRLLDQQA